MKASPAEQDPAPGTVTGTTATPRATVGRVAAFLVVLALTAAVGWQAGRILEPPLPVPAVTHDHALTHDHIGQTP